MPENGPIYTVVPLFCRPWTLNGMPAALIESHYEQIYGGELERLNTVQREIAALEMTEVAPAALVRLKRDELELLNSTVLHELYFASLGGDGRVVPDVMAAALSRDFGSVDLWRRQFITLATGLAAASGWVVLSRHPRHGRLVNSVCTSHASSLSGAVPILALDMFEHAYQAEFGANAAAYVAAFMRNIDWAAVQARDEDALQAAPPRVLEQPAFGDLPSISPEAVRSLVESGSPLHLVDVRPRHYATRARDIMAGAIWRDPERVADWIAEMPRDRPVVAFCVYGFHIGCETAAKLRAAGIDARYMTGGHAAWKAMRGPVRLFE